MSFLKQEITMPKLRAPKLRAPKLSAPKARRSGGRSRPARGRASAVTGLEIGATQLIAAEATVRSGRITGERIVARPLPPGLFRDGLVLAQADLAGEIKELFSEHRLSRRVRVGLATPRTVLRVLDLPPLDEKDIKTALRLQAQERIPMPLERAVMDYHTVGLVDTPEGTRLRVIVVVTEREGVDLLLETLRSARLKVAGIDLSIFAAIRALDHTVEGGSPVLYAQLGDLVTLGIAEAGLCRFTRQAPQGLGLVLERVAEARAIPVQEAYELLQRLTAQGPAAGAGDDVRDVFVVLARVAAELGSELRAAAEFYSTQSGVAVTTGVVAGPLVPLPGFVEALGEASGLELTCGEPVVKPDASGEVDPRIAAVACGLAVEKLVA